MTTPMVSRRAAAATKSATAVVAERANVLRARGVEIINLAEGEVEDLVTPDHVKEAAERAIRDNRTKYTPTSGIPELKDAIALRFERDNGLQVTSQQVMASTGAKQSVLNFMFAALNPGDEVLIPAPYWVSYLHQVELAGGIPVVVPASPETGFKVSGELLREHLTPRTRVLVLNNPNNPSGAVYTREELTDILDMVLSERLLVLVDEVYDQITYDGREHTSFASLAPEAANVTVTVNAVSKSHCMTGWRLGFAAGPREVITAMERVQSHSTSCPNAIAQWAAVEALTGDQTTVRTLVTALDSRRRFVVDALNDLPGLRCSDPGGAFYVFPSVSTYGDGTQFAEALLEETGVMVVPGAAFGMNAHIRICFAASRKSLERAMELIGARLKSGSMESAV